MYQVQSSKSGQKSEYEFLSHTWIRELQYPVHFLLYPLYQTLANRLADSRLQALLPLQFPLPEELEFSHKFSNACDKKNAVLLDSSLSTDPPALKTQPQSNRYPKSLFLLITQ